MLAAQPVRHPADTGNKVLKQGWEGHAVRHGLRIAAESARAKARRAWKMPG